MKINVYIAILLAIVAVGCGTLDTHYSPGSVANADGTMDSSPRKPQVQIGYGSLRMTQVVFRQELKEGERANIYVNGAFVCSMGHQDMPKRWIPPYITHNTRQAAISYEIMNAAGKRLDGYDLTVYIEPIDTSAYQSEYNRSYNGREIETVVIRNSSW